MTRTKSIKPCKKTRYSSEVFAMLDIARIRSKSNRDKVPVRAYKCPECKYWHLTSKHSRAQEAIKMLTAQLKETTKERDELAQEKKQWKQLQSRLDDVMGQNKTLRKQVNDKNSADERVKEMQTQISKQKKINDKQKEDNNYLIAENLRLKSMNELLNGYKERKEHEDEYMVKLDMEGTHRPSAMYALYSGLRMFKECQDSNLELKKQLNQVDKDAYSIPGAEAYCLMQQLKEQYPNEYASCEKEFNRAYGKPNSGL